MIEKQAVTLAWLILGKLSFEKLEKENYVAVWCKYKKD